MAAQKIANGKKEKKARLRKNTVWKKNSKKISRVVTLIFCVLLVIVVIKGVFSFIDLRDQKQQVDAKYEELLNEKAELETTLEYINTPEYIEQTARDMLKMVMPGEILFITRDDGEQGEDSNTNISADDLPRTSNGSSSEGYAD